VFRQLKNFTNTFINNW